jgi:hypothetical protein
LYQELLMNTFLRLAASVLCLGVMAWGVVAFDSACPVTFLHQWDSAKNASIAEAIGRDERLDQRKEAIRRRREAKEQVAKEVIARQRSLADATGKFRELDRQWPDIRADTKMPELVWLSEDDLDGRAVIDQFRQVLADRPDAAAAAGDRLEKELQQLLAERNKRPPAPADAQTEPSR